MITPSQIRAARMFFNIEQQVVADAVGVSKATISAIENEKGEPKASTLSNIQAFFEYRGVEFRDGGVLPKSKVIQVFEGNDAYIRLLDDVLHNAKGELLKYSVDERKSSPAVISKNQEIRNAGIAMRNLVQPGNTHLMGPEEEYRYMPERLFVQGDVKLIYGDIVAYMMAWANIPKAVLIHDATIASEQRRTFDFIWDNAELATESSAPERYV